MKVNGEKLGFGSSILKKSKLYEQSLKQKREDRERYKTKIYDTCYRKVRFGQRYAYKR